jgi:hypothetical protein
MTDPFVKLYASTLESSLWWGEDAPTRLVWITLLLAADHEGIYSGTLPGLAGKARVTLEEARVAVWRLQQPDSESRTPDFEGRRIEVLEGTGYRLLNYRRYRDKRSPRQIADAARKAASRAADTADMSQKSTPRSEILDLRDQISEDQISEGGCKGDAPAAPPPAALAAPKPKRRPRSVTTMLPDDFAPNAEHATIARDRGLDLAEVFAQFRDWAAANATRKADWNATLRNWLRREKSHHVAPRGSSGPRSINSEVFEHIFRKATE